MFNGESHFLFYRSYLPYILIKNVFIKKIGKKRYAIKYIFLKTKGIFLFLFISLIYFVQEYYRPKTRPQYKLVQ